MKHGYLKISYDNPEYDMYDNYYDVYIIEIDGIPVNFIHEDRMVHYDKDGNIDGEYIQGLFSQTVVNEIISENDLTVFEKMYGDGKISWESPLTEMK